MEWQKDLLLQEIKDLKRQDGNSAEIKSRLKEQYRILSLLEEQVALKQEEWQSEIEHITQEKSQAINVARFATQKLIETIQDFQKQNDGHKDVRNKVLEVIHHNNDYAQDTNKELCEFINH